MYIVLFQSIPSAHRIELFMLRSVLIRKSIFTPIARTFSSLSTPSSFIPSLRPSILFEMKTSMWRRSTLSEQRRVTPGAMGVHSRHFAAARPWPAVPSKRGMPAVALVRSSATPTDASAAPDTTATLANGRADLPKNFDVARESEIYKWWEESGYFKPDEAATEGEFTLSMPPPNVTGKLHMGHAMFATLQDIMVRYQRMRGKKALWLPGTDHAGIATQMVVEKMLTAQGVKRQEIGREAFVDKVWDWKQQYGGFITQQLRRLGASCDWSREAFTLDENLSTAVAEAFIRLYDKGLIYRGTYMVNWSPNLQTAVSDIEVEFTEENGKLYYFKYPVADSEDFLPVATTRPETILGDTAVAVNPNDPRYQHLIGKECVVPMSDRRIPIIADDYVDMEFGTGALKITPGHDMNDYEIGKRRNLPIINIMNKDASLNDKAGAYAGLDRFAARKKLWADMESQGLVIKAEPYTTRVPRSQRGGEVIEPLISDQWFVKMEPLAKPALAAVASGDIRILPERFEKTYNQWLEGIQDWCISRQLWWGHRIPVWYVHADESAAQRARELNEGRSETFIVARSEGEALEKARASHGPSAVLIQEVDVLDTWFSSGLWPFSTLGWPNEQAPDYKTFYPTQVMETGHDILFFWVARMIMMGLEFTGKAPFHTVFLHGLVRDAQGRKMSKSLGNVIDPVDTIAEYGTDALRFTLATGTAPGQDLNLSLERVTAMRNFTNKVWNAGKFILFNLQAVDEAEWNSLRCTSFSAEEIASLPLAERWVLSSLHGVVDSCTKAQERYDFIEAGRCVYDFLWNEFADWYIESSKVRLYAGDEAAKRSTRKVLVYAFDTLLRLLHPYMPFVTEELWQALPHGGETLVRGRWPAENQTRDPEAEALFGTLQAAVRTIRNARSEYNVELAKKIPATIVARDAAVFNALSQEAALIASLAKLEPAEFSVVREKPADAASAKKSVEAVVQEGLEAVIPLAGLFDAEKELGRLDKQKQKIEKELQGISGRLSNKTFVDKAPAAVVEEAKGQQRQLQEQLDMVLEKVKQVQQMMA